MWKEYLDSVALPQALWWFIENVTDAHPDRTEIFFYLRERVRTDVDESRNLVMQLAALCIWDYDRDDGTPYEECDEPCDGYVDSHCCLMEFIEMAREIEEQS